MRSIMQYVVMLMLGVGGLADFAWANIKPDAGLQQQVIVDFNPATAGGRHSSDRLQLQITALQSRVSETNQSFKLRLSLGASTKQEVVVYLYFAGTAEEGKDYTVQANKIVFAAGQQQTKELTINIVDDGQAECHENIQLYVALDPHTPPLRSDLLLTIEDDDLQGKELRVGPGQTYYVPSEVVRDMRAGDRVSILAGSYYGDAVTWQVDDVLLCGEGAGAELISAEIPANAGAIWTIKANGVLVENIIFRGISVAKQRADGVRVHAEHARFRHCQFIDNLNGLRVVDNPQADIVVQYSVLSGNGSGDKKSHNLRVGRISSLRLEFSKLRNAMGGHHIFSYANKNYIKYNSVMDKWSGRSEQLIEVPSGGHTYVIGNVLQQGGYTQNQRMISFGTGKPRSKLNLLYMVNNTLVNDYYRGEFVVVGNKVSASLVNNAYAGKGQLLVGEKFGLSNIAVKSSEFFDAVRYDYRLASQSRAKDAGVDPGVVDGISLRPDAELLYGVIAAPRYTDARIDAGAFEVRP